MRVDLQSAGRAKGDRRAGRQRTSVSMMIQAVHRLLNPLVYALNKAMVPPDLVKTPIAP